MPSAPSPKHPTGLHRECVRIPPQVTHWGVALVSVQVGKYPRKGQMPRSACGPATEVSVLRGGGPGRVLGGSAGNTALWPLRGTATPCCRLVLRKDFLEFGTN